MDQKLRSTPQSAKLYPIDLYDRVKANNSYIICLNQEQTGTFILSAVVKNQAHLLHKRYGCYKTLIIEPDKQHAIDRHRVLVDQTELNVINLFEDRDATNLTSSQIIISSMQSVIDHKLHDLKINLVVLNYSHTLLIQDIDLVKKIVQLFINVQRLAFMCSLIHTSKELVPSKTMLLIRKLEDIFKAKCETSSDLRSLSKQLPAASIEIVEFQPTELMTCDQLLADSTLKSFCEFLYSLSSSDTNHHQTNGDSNGSKDDTSLNESSLSFEKQLALSRSCMSDVIYSLHCLGLWCARRTIHIHLAKLSKLMSSEETSDCSLISATISVLNSLYSRTEEILDHPSCPDGGDLLKGSSAKLKALLEYIKSFQGNSSNYGPICITHVRRRVLAKVIAQWLDKVSSKNEEYSFIKANYIISSKRKHRNSMAVDNFDLHHETAVRDFRFGNCNVLITYGMGERCMDMPKCNIVISFDLPTSFSEFVHAKGSCKNESSKYVLMLNSCSPSDSKDKIISYVNLEGVLSNAQQRQPAESIDVSLIEKLEVQYTPYPSNSPKSPATIWRSVQIINKYCTKLPSDSFTKLSPEYKVRELKNDDGSTEFYCEVKLPINSPVRQTIIGPPATTNGLAIRLAAYTVCKVLHQAGELDDNMMPITKESLRAEISSAIGLKESSTKGKSKVNGKSQATGSTKHRQFYRKRIAKVFSGPSASEGVACYLYKIDMILTCPIPDEQNRRSRRIIDPRETTRNFALICTDELPAISSFPIFTRSGEVMISLQLLDKNLQISNKQIQDLRSFHSYTYSEVLRLEKYPTVYEPDNSPFTILMAPVKDDSIDWEFVEKIVSCKSKPCVPGLEERRAFKFIPEEYEDAVVIPWYRVTDYQQFAYYVAEICYDLSPQSPFTDKTRNFQTFIDYYKFKYKIDIFNISQPVLDVDHTSGRLNLLTPRYLNRKGRTLPPSTPKTRESRESLEKKQLLIPELCSIHPFPASFWRKAVCLPCIFHRLNSLFLAEELRRQVAETTKLGFVEPPPGFEWPPLHFGWSVRDESTDWEFVEEQLENTDSKPFFPEVEGRKSFKFITEKKDDTLSIPWHKIMDGQQLADDIAEIISKDFSSDLVQQKKLDCKSSQALVSVLNAVYPDIRITASLSQISSSHREWIDMMHKLEELGPNWEESDLPKEDAYELITTVEDCDVKMQPTFGELLPNRDLDCEGPSEEWKDIKFDPNIREIRSDGPGPNIILQALTMSNASDGINLERLETVGDSFLKYSITAYLYCMHPNMHEGKLSYLRSMEISNANLYKLGRSKDLGEIMSATKFEPNDNWLPPGYIVTEGTSSEDNSKKREIDKALAEVPYDLLQQHSIPDKSIADCVEALIGAYLTASGPRAALLFMRWLGLQVVPESFNLESDIDQQREKPDDSIWLWLELPPSPLICKEPSYDDKAIRMNQIPMCDLRLKVENELDLIYHSNNLDKFEIEMGYSFRDKAYLVQAFTHNSYYENSVTDCHQRLEFLGDALLDYLITRYLFEDPRCHSPGALTDLRSALVNNTFFASLAVKYKFHKYLMYISDELFTVIDRFVRKFSFGNKETITKGYTLLIGEGETEYAEDIEVPKALGDVFESVAGAIYVDSGMSLDQVWQVYFRMMKPEIEYFCSDVPRSPIRELLESMPQNVRFSPSEIMPDRKHRVIAEVFGLGRFVGYGRNKHSAKSTAAKRALRTLAFKKRQTNGEPQSGTDDRTDDEQQERQEQQPESSWC